MRKVPKTIHQQHRPSRMVVVLVGLEVLEVLVSAAVAVEQGGCNHKTPLDNWVAMLHNWSGTSRQ